MRTPRQRTAAWHDLRRSLITSTDIPVILGLSPYKSEGQLAREKLGTEPEPEPSLVMLIGQAMEPVIAAEYERQTGARLTRYAGIVRHPTIEWAAASPDYRRRGERYLVEAKDTRSRRWPSDGVPPDVEAQVQWQLGVTRFPVGDVAALKWSKLERYYIEADPTQFDKLVVIADDFRRRLAAGGPFEENVESINRKWPVDDGTELTADDDLEAAVTELIRLSALEAQAGKAADELKVRIKDRMGAATRLVGAGFVVTWRRSKDGWETNWPALAAALLDQLPEKDRVDLVANHTTVKAGSRRFLVTPSKTEAHDQ